jgi:hypothetical protein
VILFGCHPGREEGDLCDREARGTAGGWRWWGWMLWQGAVVCAAGKGPEEQGDEKAAEMDAFMRSSGVYVEER